MTQDEIIRIAREAGFEVVDGQLRLYFDGSKALLKPNYMGTVVDGMKEFAKLVAAHEKKFWMEQIEVECNEAVLAEREKQAEQEPVGYFAYDEEHDIWEELTGPNTPGATPLYAAPIRVQDLTDDEIDEIYSEYGSIPNTKAIRAVITKDREKNK